MEQYTIYWEPNKEQDFLNVFPAINIGGAQLEQPTVAWPNGWKWVQQPLDSGQFHVVDTAANNHVCIDVRPASHPVGSPTGR